MSGKVPGAASDQQSQPVGDRRRESLRTAPPAAPQRSWVWPAHECYYWLLAVVILLWQGWQRGVNLVALLGCFLLSLWVLNALLILLRFSLRRCGATRRLESPVFAGEPFAISWEVTNPTRRNQRGLRLDDNSTFLRQSWFIALLRPGEAQRRRKIVRLQRRGRVTWPALRLSTGYPFGLFRRTVRIATGDETIVLPRLGRLHRGRLRRLLQHRPRLFHATQRPRRRHPVAQTDFYGLREFRPGDSPRWIHWRTTARIGELMVREFEEPPLDNLTVIVDPWLPDQPGILRGNWERVHDANRLLLERLLASGPPPPPEKRRAKEQALAKKEEPFRVPLERMELALSLAATVLWTWHRQPGAQLALGLADEGLGVRVDDGDESGVVPLLENLALVKGGPKPDTAKLVERLADFPLPVGPVLLITTRATDLADRLSARIGRHVTALDVSQPQVGELFDIT
jgi:hypothetical protein